MRYREFLCANRKFLQIAFGGIVSAALVFPVFGPSVATAGEEGTLDKIFRTKTITIGYRSDEVPFAYRTEDGAAVGYTVELCNRIAEHVRTTLNLEKINIDYVLATAATRFVLIKSGKIDLECSATTNNTERREQVAFSYPHFITATRFVAKKSSNLLEI